MGLLNLLANYCYTVTDTLYLSTVSGLIGAGRILPVGEQLELVPWVNCVGLSKI